MTITTIAEYRRKKDEAAQAEAQGDLATAARIHLELLDLAVPDATEATEAEQEAPREPGDE